MSEKVFIPQAPPGSLFGEESPVSVLALRIGDNAPMLGLLKTVVDGHSRSGTPIPTPGDGDDSTGQICVLLMEAMIHLQKLLLEARSTDSEASGSKKYKQIFGESKLKELDLMFRQVCPAAIDTHLFFQMTGKKG